jgi:hypothetical protein
MNKRQTKKRNKKVKLFSWLEDVYSKCYKCQYFESGDTSVGLAEGCTAPFLYDENDNTINSQNDKACEYMQLKGYTCPHFLQMLGKKKYPKNNLPKSYREYEKRRKALERLYNTYY